MKVKAFFLVSQVLSSRLMNAVSLFLLNDNEGKARQTNCGKLLENFYENLVCKTKVKLAIKKIFQ